MFVYANDSRFRSSGTSVGYLVSGLALLLLLGGVSMGCSAEDGDDSGPGPGANAGGAGSAGGTSSGSFRGTVRDSVNEFPITDPPITVRALDNETGEPLPGMETVSDSNAMVTFEGLPSGLVGLMTVGIVNQSVDTYQFNIDSGAQNEDVWVVAKSSVDMAPTIANLQPDPAKADAAGAIYWINAAGEEEPVGCATVRFDSEEGEIRYFGENNLPTTNVPLENAPHLEVRTYSNPLNGRYYVGGASPGKHTITAMMNGQDLGSTSFLLFSGLNSTDGENTICISNIYVEGFDANPTPADCQ
jgi:hypothetical protein